MSERSFYEDRAKQASKAAVESIEAQTSLARSKYLGLYAAENLPDEAKA
jgi:hypothetical protein